MNKEAHEAIQARIQQIADENNGKITPELVWHDAADKDSPLHAFVEWDEKKAAYQHQLDQCRALIRSVKIVVKNDTRTITTVAYVRDPEAGAQQGYVSIARLQTDKDHAVNALRMEVRRASAAISRMESIAAALGLEDSVKEAMDKMNTINRLLAEVD